MRLAVAAAAAWLVLHAVPAQAEIYRFLDASGREQFTTNLSDVPADQRDAAANAAADRGTLSGGFTHSTPGSSSAAPSPATRATPAAQAPAGELVAGRDEAAWRKDHATHKKQIETLEAQIAACSELDAPKPQDPYGQRRNRQQEDRKADAWQTCNGAKSQLGGAERALANFEERARTQGVPPGWLR